MPDVAPDARRSVRLAVRLGVAMLAGGAQTREVETDLHAVLAALGIPDAEAVVSYPVVTVSAIAPGSAETTTATLAVRRWQPDYSRLAAGAALVRGVTQGRVELAAAEAQLARIVAMAHPYPRWLTFAAPALLSAAVAIMFGGGIGDAAATLGIGLLIQPAVERIGRSDLSAFFQVVAGVLATCVLVLALVQAGVPIDAPVVLTGALLRFLPGAALVSGMHDLIDGAVMSGAARLAEVTLLGSAIAGGIALVDSIAAVLDTPLAITAEGGNSWSAGVLVGAGMVAVACYAGRLGVPRGALGWGVLLGAVAVLLSRGLIPGTANLRGATGTLVAAIVIGAAGRELASRTEAPAALWSVPAILPLLPAPTTLVPALAPDQAARDALEGRAITTAFAIGVGVAIGSILVESWLHYRARLRLPRRPFEAAGRAADAAAAGDAPAVRPPRRRTGVSARRGRS